MTRSISMQRLCQECRIDRAREMLDFGFIAEGLVACGGDYRSENAMLSSKFWMKAPQQVSSAAQ